MNLRITSSCLVNGQHTEQGTVLNDVPAELASDLLTNGRAIVIVSRDPMPEHRDLQVEPSPAPSTKKKKP